MNNTKITSKLINICHNKIGSCNNCNCSEEECLYNLLEVLKEIKNE